jgi:hypothetical protein
VLLLSLYLVMGLPWASVLVTARTSYSPLTHTFLWLRSGLLADSEKQILYYAASASGFSPHHHQ